MARDAPRRFVGARERFHIAWEPLGIVHPTAQQIASVAYVDGEPLHHVIDEWFSRQVQPRLRGPSTLARFCDDFVMLFAHKDDAHRVLAVLGKRLGKFGLELHAEKTRLVDFRPKRGPNNGANATLPTTFNFLSCTGIPAAAALKQTGHESAAIVSHALRRITERRLAGRVVTPFRTAAGIAIPH